MIRRACAILAVAAFTWLAATALAASGDLTPLGCIYDADNADNPCFGFARALDGADGVAVSPDGTSVYVVSYDDDAIVQFRRDSSGSLGPISCVDDNDVGSDPGQGEDICAQSTDGLHQPTGVAVSPDGTSVYVVSAGDGAIVRFGRNEIGALTPAGCIDDDDFGPGTCARTASALAQAQDVAVSPDGESVYVTSFGDDAVTGFRRNLSNGALGAGVCVDDNDTGAESCAQTTDGLNGAQGLAISPGGDSVYVTSRLGDNSLVRFRRGSPGGTLGPRGCVEDSDAGADQCRQEASGLLGAYDAAVSPDGESVYVVGQRDDALVRFERDAATGAVSPQGCVDDNDTGTGSCVSSTNGLDLPRSVEVSRDGQSVYVAALRDNALTGFTRGAGGALTAPKCLEDSRQGPDACAAGDADGLARPQQLALSPEGDSLYAAAGDGIVMLTRTLPPP